MTRRALGAALLTVAVVFDVWACFRLAPLMGATNDLFPRWLATRLWVERGWDPYSADTDVAIQAAMGVVPLGGEPFVFGFVYPGYVALLLVPLALLPFEQAAALWLLLAQASCVGGSLLCWRALERERALSSAPALAPMLVGALLPASVMNLLFLQFSALAFAGLAGTWWLAARSRWVGAGALLVLTSIKPALALAPALALVAAARSRRLAATALLAGLALAIASLVALPGWPTAFWRSTKAYAAVAHPTAAAGVLADVFSAGAIGTLAIGACVSILIAARWLRSDRQLGDTLSAGTLATIWLVPPLYEWNNVVLLVPLLRAARLAHSARRSVAWAIVGALVALSLATALGYLRWSSETRALWPVAALVSYAAPVARRGLRVDA